MVETFATTVRLSRTSPLHAVLGALALQQEEEGRKRETVDHQAPEIARDGVPPYRLTNKTEPNERAKKGESGEENCKDKHNCLPYRRRSCAFRDQYPVRKIEHKQQLDLQTDNA